jgi:hypothetical protein
MHFSARRGTPLTERRTAQPGSGPQAAPSVPRRFIKTTGVLIVPAYFFSLFI